MTRRKTGFTAAKHAVVGQRLTDIRAELHSIECHAAAAYPKHHPFLRALDKLRDGLLDASIAGDEVAHAEHTGYSANWYAGKCSGTRYPHWDA